MEIELVFNPDGTVLIPRGNKAEDEVLKVFMTDLVDEKSLVSFYSISENTDLLFGDCTLCG